MKLFPGAIFKHTDSKATYCVQILEKDVAKSYGHGNTAKYPYNREYYRTSLHSVDIEIIGSEFELTKLEKIIYGL